MSVKVKIVIGFIIILLMVLLQSILIIDMNDKKDMLSKQILSLFQLNTTMKDKVIDVRSLQADALNKIVPTDDGVSYDMREVLARIFDHESVFELHPDFAANALVGFARLDGQSVGFVANQPTVMSGCCCAGSITCRCTTTGGASTPNPAGGSCCGIRAGEGPRPPRPRWAA